MTRFLHSKSRTFFLFCFSFLLAVALVSIWDFNFSMLYLLTTLFVLLFFIIIFWKNLLFRFLCFCLLFFILGLVRYYLVLLQNTEKDLLHYVENTKVVEGFVSAEPDIRLDGVRYIGSALFVSDSKWTVGV